MRFLVDECAGPAVAAWLLEQGHEVFSIFDQARGIEDGEIIRKSFEENWILLTTDKDFGDQVYREHKPHHGVVLLRLVDERSIVKIKILRQLLSSYSEQLSDQFVVVTEKNVRFAK